MDTELPPIATIQIDGLTAEVTDVQRVPAAELKAPSPDAPEPCPQIDRRSATEHGVWLCRDARPDQTGTVQGGHLVTGDKLRVVAAGHPTPWNMPAGS